jgi:hypothetical protein
LKKQRLSSSSSSSAAILSFTNPKTKHGFWKRKNFHHHLHHPFCSFITAVPFPFFRMQKLALSLSLSLSERILALSLSESNPQKWALV